MSNGEEVAAVRVSIGNGGWLCYRASDLDEPIFVRVRKAEDGRFEMCDLYIPFESPADARRLRDIAERAATVETFANDPEWRDSLEARLDLPAPDLRTAAAHYATTFGKPADHWVWRMFASQIEGSDEPQAPRPRWKPRPSKPEPQDFTFALPEERPYPDEFYKRIGALYAKAAVRSDRPAADLAEANDVPVKTVHRWVAKARELGFLAPGRKGRAG